MSTSLQRTSLGELGYTSLGTTSLGELGGIVQTIIEFFGGNDGTHIEDDRLILAIIKAFIARV